MVKLLKLSIAVFMLLTFASCSEDDEKEYYNPVEGRWMDYGSKEDCCIIRVYTKNFESYNLIYENGELKVNDGHLFYTIDEKYMYYPKGKVEYKIVVDTLWVYTSIGISRSTRIIEE